MACWQVTRKYVSKPDNTRVEGESQVSTQGRKECVCVRQRQRGEAVEITESGGGEDRGLVTV